jgi:peptidoglycan-associated lipoprotein
MKRTFAFLAALALLAACESPPESMTRGANAGGAGSGAGAGAGAGGSNIGRGGLADAGRNAQGGARDLQEALVQVGDRVYFDSDSSSLRDDGRATLTKQATWLQQFAQNRVVIEGHCDDRGTREYNLALGARRAEAARGFLINQGVSGNRITTISYGKERPVAVGSNEQAWAQNRRAVTVVATAGS